MELLSGGQRERFGIGQGCWGETNWSGLVDPVLPLHDRLTTILPLQKPFATTTTTTHDYRLPLFAPLKIDYSFSQRMAPPAPENYLKREQNGNMKFELDDILNENRYVELTKWLKLAEDGSPAVLIAVWLALQSRRNCVWSARHSRLRRFTVIVQVGQFERSQPGLHVSSHGWNDS
ncbi:hypothetical protein M0804_000860 [Polistes exclamans]|nr:hypothetical protein M0804_000860 [Polistes exclamans]